MMGRMRALMVAMVPIALVLASGARTSAAAAAPLLRVAQTEVDLGARNAGPPLWFPFRLRNEGSAPLEIREVKLSCGCMAAKYAPMIAPAEEMILRVKMATADAREGNVAKLIRVMTNDPQTPVVRLVARAQLRATIQVLPGRYLALSLAPGREAVQEVTLQSREAPPLEIKRVETSVGVLRAEPLPAGEDRHERRVRLRVASADASRPFLAKVIVHTNSHLLPRLLLTVEGYRQGFVRVLPQRLAFGAVDPEPATSVVRLLILMRTQRPIQITAARSDSPALTVEFHNEPEAPYVEVRVTYRGGWKPGKVKGKLTFALSDRDCPAVEVPYAAEVRAGMDRHGVGSDDPTSLSGERM